jgi:hypothetical protein
MDRSSPPLCRDLIALRASFSACRHATTPPLAIRSYSLAQSEASRISVDRRRHHQPVKANVSRKNTELFE